MNLVIFRPFPYYERFFLGDLEQHKTFTVLEQMLNEHKANCSTILIKNHKDHKSTVKDISNQHKWRRSNNYLSTQLQNLRIREDKNTIITNPGSTGNIITERFYC